ncbi:Stk1 family PASTA domain-containing Ser/Thr kinase [Rhodococcus rhodnii]|uniref:non-specific serine/threonine protein kinase n=2 Tax=Rhodococcus rhodnii TaxID=38312 RepID=R7WJS2_9NOCA|nr:Stk1 family PASTA domain-containing Ser/Thr kinase [Rhodococcus rhodnii]EOM74244.1 serine/threonine kinase PknB [Rhodococcus rhodnii LMG 5362]TXG89604.1 Stk1 family PASTA domain-containing Ser/Thr kinase [Rhodococcus rhodnii]
MTTPRNLSSRYELGEILGFGGMSEVHLARDVRLSRDVAIKVLRADLARDPTFYLRFRREAQNAAALNHPAIVAVYDTGEAETEAGPLPYIVMEYVEGDTLRDIVRTSGPLTPRRAMEVVSDVCAALDFSHRNGIVHRDVKPANVMITRNGAVKVMDFGIARAISDASQSMTQTAAVIGTAQYLSPEQARGEQVDARSDVYSLGCVLFEVLTGEPPFSGDSPVAVAVQHVREDPRLPSTLNPDIPRELDSIILKAMSKNPANRYQSAADMRSDLVRVLGGQRPSAPMVMNDDDITTIIGAVGDDDRPARGGGKRWKIALLSLAGIAVVAIVGFFLASVYSAPGRTEVPDVTNLAADEAETTLQNAGLRVTRQVKPDPVVAEGNIVGTRPVGGAAVDEGSTVTLEVSSGPAQVDVPQLTGMTADEAQRALADVGLTLDRDVEEGPSSREDVDKVIDQDPSPAASIASGSPVKITVGSGPEQIRVPDVTGQQEDVARANVEGAGFEVDVSTVDSGQPRGTVVSMNPPGGTSADSNSTVELRVSTGSNIPMPDLTNQTVSQALATLRQSGWTGTSQQLQQSQTSTLDPDMVGKVLSQQQPPGSEVSRDATISVNVGQLGIPR